jgi:hypothetical protein
MGEHHFYISFDTHAPGVRISDRLREQYPEEMTIVLQHQFWDLNVSEEGFEVGLAFKGVPERLVVPFAALKGFFDPSVQFALQFETIASEGAETNEAAAAPRPRAEADTKPRRGARPKPAKVPAPVAPVAVATPPESASDATNDKPDRPTGGGEVVRLDRFRKK